MIRTMKLTIFSALLIGLSIVGPTNSAFAQPSVPVHHKTVMIGDLEIFYREAGPKDAPTILLLHGFPTSSQMFRNLIPALADQYHVIAPDYPGFGHSSMPLHDQFAYTFDNLADVMGKFTDKIGLKSYALYVMDYGAPVGYRLAVKHPERVTAIIVQNGNAYDEGLDNDFWKPIKAYWAEPKSQEKRDAIRNLVTYEATKWQYLTGAKDPELVSPDGAAHDQFLLDRKGNDEIQLDLFLSYGSNPPLYPSWQEYFRKHQPTVGGRTGNASLDGTVNVPRGADQIPETMIVTTLRASCSGHQSIMTSPTDQANWQMAIAQPDELEWRELAQKSPEGHDTQHGHEPSL